MSISMEEKEESGGQRRQSERDGSNSCGSDGGGGVEGAETAFEAERGDDGGGEEEVDVVDDDDDGENNGEERNGFLLHGRFNEANGLNYAPEEDEGPRKQAIFSPKDLCFPSPLSAFTAGTTTVSPRAIFPTLVSPPPVLGQHPPISLNLSPSAHSALHSPDPTPPPPPSLGVPPPLLFQPFLPTAAAGPNRNAAAAERSALPFSIDNILKPSFGQRLRLLQSMAAAAAARERLHSAFQPRVIKSEPPGAGVPASPPSPSESVASSLNSNLNNNRPVDLSPPKTSPGGEKRPPSSPSSSLPKNEKDPDCPPGMVRGPNGQLWPAWVFCTRYSDRPSSGEYYLGSHKTSVLQRPHLGL